MLDQIHLLAAVTVLGVLEQAYFFLQVIYARRTFGISPPKISGPPEFERIFRAQSGCILGSALSLLSLLLLYGLQGIVVRKAHPHILRHRSPLGPRCSGSPGPLAFLPGSLRGAERPAASHSVTRTSGPRRCLLLRVLLPLTSR
ncbi:uncharacterized protein [Struthio camelus]|uniref:uncharacterized protein isoform X3 n=1 Tax=Struthio camelus TaxID=8801 RepID=UPI00360425B0